MFLPNRRRPFKIKHHKAEQVFTVHDGEGKWLVGFSYWHDRVSITKPTMEEAEEMAKAFARLSRE